MPAEAIGVQTLQWPMVRRKGLLIARDDQHDQVAWQPENMAEEIAHMAVIDRLNGVYASRPPYELVHR